MAAADGARAAVVALRPRVAVVRAATSVADALSTAADHLGLPPLPHVGHLCPRCGSDRHGRPFLPGLDDVQVSISRTRGVHVAAVSLGARVGVDVELARDVRLAEVAGVLLHPHETTTGPEQTAVTWVRKEAVVKAWASGLTVDPRSIRLSDPGETPVLLTAPAAYDGLPTWLVDLRFDDGLVGCVAVVSSAGTRRQRDDGKLRQGRLVEPGLRESLDVGGEPLGGEVDEHLGGDVLWACSATQSRSSSKNSSSPSVSRRACSSSAPRL